MADKKGLAGYLIGWLFKRKKILRAVSLTLTAIEIKQKQGGMSQQAPLLFVLRVVMRHGDGFQFFDNPGR